MIYKICPVCNNKNSPQDMICKKCLSTIQNIEATDYEENQQSLKLKFENNELIIKDNDILGREAVGNKIFEKYLTVSREHIKFLYTYQSTQILYNNI
jgi:hypothetical protein